MTTLVDNLRGLLSDSTCILKAKPGNLISKGMNLVFYLSVYPLLNILQASDCDVVLIQHHSKSEMSL